MNSTNEKIYWQIFETAVQSIENRRRIDPSFTIECLQRLLDTEYIVQGNDQFGRGGAFELRLKYEKEEI